MHYLQRWRKRFHLEKQKHTITAWRSESFAVMLFSLALHWLDCALSQLTAQGKLSLEVRSCKDLTAHLCASVQWVRGCFTNPASAILVQLVMI